MANNENTPVYQGDIYFSDIYFSDGSGGVRLRRVGWSVGCVRQDPDVKEACLLVALVVLAETINAAGMCEVSFGRPVSRHLHRTVGQSDTMD